MPQNPLTRPVGSVCPAPGATFQGAYGPYGVWVAVNGDQIYTHPNFHEFKADTCKVCKHVVPIRPMKFKDPIPKETMEEYIECFAMFDKDGDGTIDTKELGAVMRSLGQFPDDEELEEMVRQFKTILLVTFWLPGVTRGSFRNCFYSIALLAFYPVHSK